MPNDSTHLNDPNLNFKNCSKEPHILRSYFYRLLELQHHSLSYAVKLFISYEWLGQIQTTLSRSPAKQEVGFLLIW